MKKGLIIISLITILTFCVTGFIILSMAEIEFYDSCVGPEYSRWEIKNFEFVILGCTAIGIGIGGLISTYVYIKSEINWKNYNIDVVN